MKWPALGLVMHSVRLNKLLLLCAHRWTLPSSIGVSGFNGDSLFGLLNASIGEELAHFPVGPALGDKFWLYFITWHVGLFSVMLLGQIGVQGRKQGYF